MVFESQYMGAYLYDTAAAGFRKGVDRSGDLRYTTLKLLRQLIANPRSPETHPHVPGKSKPVRTADAVAQVVRVLTLRACG